jgi:hypothetical protein
MEIFSMMILVIKDSVLRVKMPTQLRLIIKNIIQQLKDKNLKNILYRLGIGEK